MRANSLSWAGTRRKGNPNLNHKHITIGSYDMVYTGTTNDDHGGNYFMSLYTVNVAQISMERGTNR